MASLWITSIALLISLYVTGARAVCYYRYYCSYLYDTDTEGDAIAAIVVGVIIFIGLVIAAIVMWCVKVVQRRSSRGRVITNPNNTVAVISPTASSQPYPMYGGYSQPPPPYGQSLGYPSSTVQDTPNIVQDPPNTVQYPPPAEASESAQPIPPTYNPLPPK